MEGTDESTELWRHPFKVKCLVAKSRSPKCPVDQAAFEEVQLGRLSSLSNPSRTAVPPQMIKMDRLHEAISDIL